MELDFSKDVDMVGDATSTLPTVGTNLVDVTVNKRCQITVRELGGCMGPIWHNYYQDCHLVIYMVDMSNRLQISAACVQLLACLGNEDLPTTMSRFELESLFRMDDIIKNSAQKISILEISSFDGKGLDSVLKWLQENCERYTLNGMFNKITKF
ncbi:hypothetical protein KUTeg_004486 [Tegillarca granosa]|uniref:ADP-ribosylation factor-like protein 16 n=1 Tax=Tegillarca granosa TaxID=220873 RepID=A0ABQ9FUK8_TEGGR|nr:hypothetical protein KUTeg_004486 [Tegillarca granosa]